MQYTLHLTEACNLACRYCGLKQRQNYMSRETAFKSVDLALSGKQKTVGIGFYGGEPLLRKDLIADTVRYAKEKNAGCKKLFFKLTTNGLLLDDEFLEYAAREGLLISLSLDGNRAAHDTNRIDQTGSGTYDRLLNIIPGLLAHNPYAAAMMTIAPNTAGQYCDSVKTAFALGFKNVICSMDYHANWNEKDLSELKNQYKQLASLYYQKTVAENKFFLSPFDSKINSHIQHKEYCRERCKLGFEQLSISADGALYPCVQFAGDSLYQIGHVKSGIAEERRKEIYQKSRIEQPECRQCSIKDRCLHSCACINKYSTGSLNEPSPVLCTHERMLIPIADRVAARLYKKRNGLFIHKQYNENYSLVSLIEDFGIERNKKELSHMKLEPVKTHSVNYPDKYQVNLNRLLIKHPPNRWKNSQAAALLLIALAVPQLAGCRQALQQNEPQSTMVRKMNMAPIFEGTPYSENGPVAVSGLSFKKQKADIVPLGNYPGLNSILTEESALVIIQDELNTKGLGSKSSKKKVEIAGGKSNSSTWSFDLNISGAKEAVYAEFIPLAGAETQSELSERKAQNLPDAPKEATAALREKLCEVRDASTGVIFYAYDGSLDQEQNLREQVDEFVTWLKTTGLWSGAVLLPICRSKYHSTDIS